MISCHCIGQLYTIRMTFEWHSGRCSIVHTLMKGVSVLLADPELLVCPSAFIVC